MGCGAGTHQAPLQLGPDHPSYVEEVENKFPNYFEIAAAEHRGITLAQLQQVCACAKSLCAKWRDLRSGEAITPSSFNLYHLNDWLIKPCTKSKACSFVELLAHQPQRPAWFVSHWWGERVVDFIRCLQEHSLQRLYDEAMVTLTYIGGESPSFGIDFEQFDQRSLLITAIGTTGLVVHWNNTFPDKAVRVGDFIVGASYVRPHEFPFQNVDSLRKILTATKQLSGNTVSAFHLQIRRLHASAYWACAYANRQHALEEDLTCDPRSSSFFKAMRLAQGLLLILDDKTNTSGPATPFTRIWCAFEAFVALNENEGREKSMLFDIAASCGAEVSVLASDCTDADEKAAEGRTQGSHYFKTLREQSFPVKVIEKGLDVRLEKAQASQEADRRHILNSLARRDELEQLPMSSDNRERIFELDPVEECPIYTKVNRSLSSKIAVAVYRQALEHGLVESLNLPHVISSDVHLESLILSFRGYRSMTDSHVASLARGLPPSLLKLYLDFSWCSQITKAGIAALAVCLPPNLQELTLLLQGTKVPADMARFSADDLRKWIHPAPATPPMKPLKSEPKKVSSQTQKTDFMNIKVLLLGDSDAGKYQLIKDFCRTDDGPSIAKIGIEFKIRKMELNGQKLKMQVWDTAGQERFRTISPSFFSGCDGLLIVYNLCSTCSFKGIADWIKQADDACSPDTQRVLIGNWPDPFLSREVSTEEGQELAHQLGACFFETARDRKAVDEAFECLASWVMAQRESPTAPITNQNNQQNVTRPVACQPSISASP